jgi:hypothetical protein
MIRRVRRRTSIAVLGLMACVALGVVGVQSAVAADVEVTIHYNGDGFQGRVKSNKDSCIKDRTVKVWKKGKSHAQYKDTTDNQGKWDTGNSGQVHGKFYATVNAKAGCDPAKSSTIDIP